MHTRLLILLATALPAALALAHGTAHGRHDATGSYDVIQTPFGIAGNPKQLSRTIMMEMDDDMRFTPPKVTVQQGATIRFVLHNKGKMLHEWVLGTAADLKEHAAMMKKSPGMEHDEVHMVHVQPGEMEEVTWHFNRAGVFQFACLMPGHFDAGMTGTVMVVSSKK